MPCLLYTLICIKRKIHQTRKWQYTITGHATLFYWQQTHLLVNRLAKHTHLLAEQKGPLWLFLCASITNRPTNSYMPLRLVPSSSAPHCLVPLSLPSYFFCNLPQFLGWLGLYSFCRINYIFTLHKGKTWKV